MSLAPGSKLGAYEIVAPAGAGGMGEVYRARDTRLERTVAIKVLGPEFSGDLERLRRFEQEARSASALNHPNIVTIHDVGSENGTSYLAMEFVEGKTLREVVGPGPLPVKKALAIAAQVADGLAQAHGGGIVHRDLKPENIMVTGEGVVKVLDFGVAKLVMPAGELSGATATAVMPATHPGMVLGTVGYMSPEQARGAAVDFRSDQFALGTILYEMLTGKRAFQRESSAQTLAAIIEDDPPPISELNPKAPAPVRWIVERCLAKEPEERYAATRDLARDLQRVRDHLSEASSGVTALVQPSPAALRRRWTLPMTVAAALLLGVGLGAWIFRAAPAPPPIIRNLTFSGVDEGPAASPDGRSVVFTSWRDGQPRIWMKQLSGGGEVPITAGPDFEPRFSPDGAQIVFSRREQGKAWIYRAAIVGGDPRRLAEGRSPDWSPDGRQIAFVRGADIYLVAADGSDLRQLKTLPIANSSNIRAVRWSPKGDWLVAQTIPSGLSSEHVTFWMVSADGTQAVSVSPAFPGGDLSVATWISDHEVLYVRSASVGNVGPVNIGASRVVVQQVPQGPAREVLWLQGGSTVVEVLASGTVVLDAIVARENLREIPVVSKPGQASGERWLTHGSSGDRQPVYSPDGQWVVFTSNRSGNLDLWEVSTRDGSLRRLTDHPSEDWDPGFTPDGKLIWTSHRSGNFEIWMAEADGSGARQVSHDGVDAENATATREWILYNSGQPEHPGLYRVRYDGSDVRLIVQGVTNWPEASPDGQYVMASAARLGRGKDDPATRRRFIAVYRISDGQEVGRIELTGGVLGGTGVGRARWIPDGRSVAFIDTDQAGVAGIYQQDFVAGKDTSATRRQVLSDPDRQPETLGVSRDGRHITYGVIDTSSNLLMVEGLAGVGK